MIKTTSPQPPTDYSKNLSWRRWPIIIIFMFFAMTSTFQNIQFVVIPELFTTYYNVDINTISWTSMIHMAVFIPVLLPAMVFIDNSGLRTILLVGSGLNALGTIIKCAMIKPELFWLGFFGQFVGACAKCFILPLPLKIAATWFPSNEVSLAASIGVIGYEAGWAVGFLVPPLIITGPVESFRYLTGENGTFNGAVPTDWRDESRWSQNVTNGAMREVADQITVLFTSFAGVCVFLFLLVLIVVRDSPMHPPSRSYRRQSEQIENRRATRIAKASINGNISQWQQLKTVVVEFVDSVKRMTRSTPFILLLVSYGLNAGVYYAITTLLNQIVKPTLIFGQTSAHTDVDRNIGLMGAISLIIVGVMGSFSGGLMLDKFKKFKVTSLVFYVCSFVFMICFAFTIQLQNVALDFCTIGLLGFFLTGYISVGFELAAELTYPESPATTSALLMFSAQIFGIIITQSCQSILNNVGESTWYKSEIWNATNGPLCANIVMMTCLSIGLVITSVIREDLRRQAGEQRPSGEFESNRHSSITR